MVTLMIAVLFSASSFAHQPASVPSMKNIVKKSEVALSESDAVVRAIDLNQEKVVQNWLNSGHSSSSKVNNKIKESLLDRAASHGSDRVFDVLLSDLENKVLTPKTYLTDSRGTPVLLSLVSLAVPGQKLIVNYECMIDRLLKTHSDQASAQDHAYVGDGRTALHQAAGNGNLSMMNLLLEHGAPINSLNASGETPLHFAARFGQIATLKVLIENGAKLDVQSKHTRETPLLTAAEMGYESIIRILLDAGAKKTEKDAFGKTAPERYKEYVANFYQRLSSSKN